MKRIYVYRLLICALLTCILSGYVSLPSASAAENMLHDDFEEYAVGNQLYNVGYTRFHGAEVGGNDENKYLVLLREDLNTDARLLKDYTSEPDAEQIIISLDFMMPDDPRNYNAQIFGVLSDDGNTESAYINLENGILYDGKTSDATPVRTNLEKEKWYNAFLVVDLVNDTYKIYSGEYSSGIKPFQKPVKNMTDIFFHVRVHNFDSPLYFDNVDVSKVTYGDLDVALCEARGLLSDTVMGYENGQYPQTAVNMLKYAYDFAFERCNDEALSADAADSLGEALKSAIKKFKSSKIDTESPGGSPNYFQFDIPKEIAVDEAAGVTRKLEARVFDKTNALLDADINWELLQEYDGVSVDNGNLVVESGTKGNIILKASCADIYDFHNVNLTEGKILQSITVESRYGCIDITGKFNSKPSEAVNISVLGEDIEISDTVCVSDDASFRWTKTVSSDKAFQFITVTIEGNDTAKSQTRAPFYGDGWNTAVLKEINEAESSMRTGELIKTFHVGLDVEELEYMKYQSTYENRIYNGITYANFSDLIAGIKELKCVIAFDKAGGEDIENTVGIYSQLLSDNGFDKSKFDDLSSEQQTMFFASALNISIDVSSAAVSDIAKALNAITEKIHSSAGADLEPIGAMSTVFHDDYESYNICNSLGGAGYGLRNDIKVGGDEKNQYLIMQRTMPMEEDELYGSDNNKTNARVSKEFEEEPAEEVIVGLEFMMPDDPRKYSSEIFGVMSDDGNYYAANIRMEGGILYDGRQTSSTPVRTGLKQGKWYHAFLVLDLVNNKYTVHCGEFASQTMDFQGKVVEKTNRLLMIRLRNYNQPLYIDNVDILAVKNHNLAIALTQAKSLILNSDIGCENGQRPPTAYNMLKNTYVAMMTAASDEKLSSEQANIYASAMNAASEQYIGNKIDKDAVGAVASYFVFNIPDAVGVDENAGYTRKLSAKVYDSKNQHIDSTVTWELTKPCTGVTISGDTLRIKGGTKGSIVIKAVTGDIYDLHTLTLTSCKTVQEVTVDSRNGNISVKGRFNGAPLENVNITVNGADINLSGILSVENDGTFFWSETVSKDLPVGVVSLCINGEDVVELKSQMPFYGVGWKDAVLNSFNAAESPDATGKLIETYYVGIDADITEYKKYKNVYSSYLFKGKNFTSFSDLTNAVKDLQCIIAFEGATRNDIESVLNAHMDSLVRGGFKKSNFDGMKNEQKVSFYASVAALPVNSATTQARDIATALNTVISKIAENSAKVKNYAESGGGGGGASSGVSSDYKVGLVSSKGETESDAGKTDADISDTNNFKDASQTPWASNALLYMKQKCIMEGDGTNVRPIDAITRGEFAKILVKAFELSSTNSTSFTDGDNSWWQIYANTVSEYGIMNGIAENVFGGEQYITRQMLAVAVARVIDACKVELYDKNEGIIFNDSDAIADYAKASVEALAKKGIVSGIGDGLFAPDVPVKRAEAAQMIYNVLTGK